MGSRWEANREEEPHIYGFRWNGTDVVVSDKEF